jgi:magnesium chelatase family protein
MKAMHYQRLVSSALTGLEGLPVEIEVSILPGLPNFDISGRCDPAVHESRDRVRAAICNSGYHFPKGRVIASYAPAALPKQGSAFDLALSIAILAASGQIIAPARRPAPAFLGELSLNGQVKPVKGILGRLMALEAAGISQVVGPLEGQAEAQLLERMDYQAVASLKEAVERFSGIRGRPSAVKGQDLLPKDPTSYLLDGIRGQEEGIRAISIAAAGWHPLLLLGAPGCGKSMLASALPQILPDMDKKESLEVGMAYSAAGKDRPSASFRQRPFRRTHHSITSPALIGGGSLPQPGECSLAHRGVLFLDELTEMNPRVLDSLREPLEVRAIHLARSSWKLTFPSDFLLVAAANPCRCGHLLEPGSLCRCPDGLIRRHLSRISGPLLDRFDLVSMLTRVPSKNLLTSRPASQLNRGQAIRGQVARAWQIQKTRQGCLNSQLQLTDPGSQLDIDKPIMAFAGQMADSAQLSARAFYSMLLLARTIADLDLRETVTREDLAEAFHYKAKLPWPDQGGLT